MPSDFKYQSIDFKSMTHQGVAETIKHRIYELQLPVEVRHIDRYNDEGEINKDIMEDYRN